MDRSPELYWLPAPPEDWRTRLKALAALPPDEASWTEAVALSRFRLNFIQTNALGTIVRDKFSNAPSSLSTKAERLAVLSTATTEHLHEGLRVAALRRGVWMDVRSGGFGQYRQDVIAADSFLEAFRPTAILLSLDAHHLTRGVRDCRTQDDLQAFVDSVSNTLIELWSTARKRFGCEVYQQALMPVFSSTFGGNEHRHPASPQNAVRLINARLRDLTGVNRTADLVALDVRVQEDGLAAWHSGPLWNRSKQETTPSAAPMFGDIVSRMIGARQGLSAKCCVVDLDNTLWGGVIGDDGDGGIIVGQGTALGEAFVDMQDYLLDLRRRGIVLAVCSKNDEAVARRPFVDNPDMKLKESDFACFIANWDDKATNLRRIAQELNIGLDALAFVDDNPVERAWVQRQLPMVIVPELPPDPASYPRCLADCGCFEGLSLTTEDLARAEQYGAARQMRQAVLSSPLDLGRYLEDLEMELVWGLVTDGDVSRVAQLINKTNQFNLTTRRYSEEEIRQFGADQHRLCLQMRLLDKFGDNGLIAVVIGKLDTDKVLEIDTWLMSCRVIGRHVEEATLNVVAEAARSVGVLSLRGLYRPTKKNGMVRDHYERLGFAAHAESAEEKVSLLDLAGFSQLKVPMLVREDQNDG